MRSTSIWGVKSLDPWDQVHIFWGPKSLANHKSYFKDRWVLFNCRSLSTHSHTTTNQFSRFSARRCSSYGFSRWWSSPPGMLRPLAEERLHSPGFGCQKVVPHEIPPQSDEPFFDLACRSCAEWALNLCRRPFAFVQPPRAKGPLHSRIL